MNAIKLLSRSEMKNVKGGDYCPYSDCSCKSTYACYREMCDDVYGWNHYPHDACIQEIYDLEAACLSRCVD